MGFWTPSSWYLAEALHVVASIAVMYAALYHLRPNLWKLAGLIAVVTGLKEFLIDTSPFELDSAWGSAQDWLCYLVGVAAVALALRYRRWAGAALAVGAILLLFLIDVLAQHGVGL